MSKQFNLFWGDADDPVIFDALRASLGEFSVVLERGIMEELSSQQVTDVEMLRELKIRSILPASYYCIVLDNDISSLKLDEVKPKFYVVRIRECPVIEFSPSKEKENTESTLIIGRFFFAFTSNDNLNRRYESLIRRLRKKCVRVPGSAFMWSMPSGVSYRFLSDGIKKPFLNPMFKQQRN